MQEKPILHFGFACLQVGFFATFKLRQGSRRGMILNAIISVTSESGISISKMLIVHLLLFSIS